MLTRARHGRRTLWLALALILPVAYVCQLVPHAHAVHPHEEAHAAPPPHGHHSHSHGDHHHEDPEAGGPESAHHHHALTHHLEFHSLRIQQRDSDPDPDLTFEIFGLDLDTQEPPSRAVPASRPVQPPGTIAVVAGGPRAPPHRG